MERLGQDRYASEAASHAVRAVTAREHERDVALVENVGRGEALVPPQIDVKNGGIDISVARQHERLVEQAGQTDDVPSKINQEILDHHGDHRFVFDNQDA